MQFTLPGTSDIRCVLVINGYPKHPKACITAKSNKELTNHSKGIHRSVFELKKPHENNAVRFKLVPARGTRFRLT